MSLSEGQEQNKVDQRKSIGQRLRRLRPRKRFFKAFFLATCVGLVWEAAFLLLWNIELKPPEDTSSFLVSVASLALFIFSSLIAVGALFGFQSIVTHVVYLVTPRLTGRIADFEAEARRKEKELQKTIADLEKANAEIIAATEKRFLALEQQIRGRLETGLGYVIGESASDPRSFKILDRGRLMHAVDLCEIGYEKLKDLGEGSKLMSLNNFAFYQSKLGNPRYSADLLDRASELREATYHPRCRASGQYSSLLLTFARIVVLYSTNREQILDAEAQVLGLLEEGGIKEHQKTEALLCKAAFTRRAAKGLSLLDREELESISLEA